MPINSPLVPLWVWTLNVLASNSNTFVSGGSFLMGPSPMRSQKTHSRFQFLIILCMYSDAVADLIEKILKEGAVRSARLKVECARTALKINIKFLERILEASSGS